MSLQLIFWRLLPENTGSFIRRLGQGAIAAGAIPLTRLIRDQNPMESEDAASANAFAIEPDVKERTRITGLRLIAKTGTHLMRLIQGTDGTVKAGGARLVILSQKNVTGRNMGCLIRPIHDHPRP